MNTASYFYRDKPVFGLDIGFASMKAMQIDTSDKPKIVGYGVSSFDSNAIKDGVIVDHETLAKAAIELFKNGIIGDISTRRVAFTVPAARTFSRVIKLPNLAPKELAEAVRTEAEQYIPMPIDELYMDYDIIARSDKEIELFAVAVPKKIIDSYMMFSRLTGLETVAMESTIGAAARLFLKTNAHDIPTVLIDFGSVSTDITIFDRTLIVTGTVPGGGDTFSDRIAAALNVTKREADVIKIKYGLDLSKKQREISDALKPFLDQLLKEISRMIRYYEERYGSERKLSQVVTMGGGANMPGLNEYLTNQLRLPVQTSDPWQHIAYSKLELPNTNERSMYVTVSGVALINSGEIFS
ncbi:MAG: type IV pilus assembly protein PilM [Candidatus Saccharimonadales bacterium]